MTTEGFLRLNGDYVPTELYVYLKDENRTGPFIQRAIEEHGSMITANTDYVESN